jgi:integrase
MRAKTSPLSGAIRSYLLSLVLAPATKAGYASTLGCFERRLSERLSRTAMIADLTAENLNVYLNALLRPTPGKPKGKRRMAHNTAIDVITFARWCVKRKMSATFDFDAVRVPKVSKDGRTTIIDRDLMTVLSVAKKAGARTEAIILTGLGHGLRLNELRLLELGDVDFESGVITVRAETSKSDTKHEIPLDPLAAAALDTYINDWRPPSSSPVLFLTESGYPFTYRGFSSMAQRLSEQMAEAGVANFCFHQMRGTWATNAHRKGHSPKDIQQQGGWKNMDMVMRYTKGRPMAELKRLPAPLASIVHDFELAEHAAVGQRRRIKPAQGSPMVG